MRNRVIEKFSVQIELLGWWCQEQCVEHGHELFVRMVHAVIACVQLSRPIEARSKWRYARFFGLSGFHHKSF